MQMESAFSETRRAAGLLQQFGGFPFQRTMFITFFSSGLISCVCTGLTCFYQSGTIRA